MGLELSKETNIHDSSGDDSDFDNVCLKKHAPEFEENLDDAKFSGCDDSNDEDEDYTSDREAAAVNSDTSEPGSDCLEGDEERRYELCDRKGKSRDHWAAGEASDSDLPAREASDSDWAPGEASDSDLPAGEASDSDLPAGEASDSDWAPGEASDSDLEVDYVSEGYPEYLIAGSCDDYMGELDYEEKVGDDGVCGTELDNNCKSMENGKTKRDVTKNELADDLAKTAASQLMGGEQSNNNNRVDEQDANTHVEKKIKKYGRRPFFICKVCTRTFTTLVRFHNHYKTHLLDVRRTKCSACDYVSTKVSNLKRHESICTRVDGNVKPEPVPITRRKQAGASNPDDLIYGCEICSQSFTSIKFLKTHHTNVHEKAKEVMVKKRGEHECTECGVSYKHKSHLSRHLLSHSASKPSHDCDVCGRSFSRKDILKTHQSTHGDVNPEPCLDCGKVFIYPGSLARHRKDAHGLPPPVKEETFECKLCDIQFTERRYLNRHVRKWHGDDSKPTTYDCAICRRRLLSRQALTKHLLQLHCNMMPYPCSRCETGFLTETQLTRHMDTRHNSGEGWRYSCAKCARYFPHQLELERHMIVHGEDWVTVKVGEVARVWPPRHACGKPLTAPEQLMRRRLIASRGPHQSCSRCALVFVDAAALTKHRKRAHGLPPQRDDEETLECESCSLRFTERRYLNRHVRKWHSDESKPAFHCAICGKLLSSRRSLTFHLLLHCNIVPRHSCSPQCRYICGDCNHQFRVKWRYDRHMIIHSERMMLVKIAHIQVAQ